MLTIITKIAKEAGKILLKHYKTDVKVDYKRDEHDPVTAADHEADAFIRKELKKNFPKDKILSEESKDVPKDYSGRVWMVDPLDGTKDFVKQMGSFSVMIGLCIDGRPGLGVVYLPVRDELFYAEKEAGAFLVKSGKKKKIAVSKVAKIGETRMITRKKHGGERPLDHIAHSIPVKELIEETSAGIKIAHIAEGKADAHINSNIHISKWDTCAPQIILEEAGGKLTDIHGKPLNYKQKTLNWEKSFVASNKLLHTKIIKEIQKRL